MDMDISMDIDAKSVDMDMDMDGKFHIHGNPDDFHTGWNTSKTISRPNSLRLLFGLTPT